MTLRSEIAEESVVTEAGPVVQLADVGVRCTSAEYQTLRRSQEVRATLTAATTGFRSPSFQWRVGGIPIGGSLAVGDSQLQTLSLVLEVQSPTAYGEASVFSRTIPITATAAWNVLELSLPPGDGRYQVPVGVNVTDTGHLVSTSQTTETVDVSTLRFDLPPEAIAAQHACTDWLRGAVEGKVVVDERPPTVRGPGWGRRDVDELRRQLQGIRDMQPSPYLAERALQEIASKIGLPPDQLRRLAEGPGSPIIGR